MELIIDKTYLDDEVLNISLNGFAQVVNTSLNSTGSYLTKAFGISDGFFDTGSSPDSIVFFDETLIVVLREKKSLDFLGVIQGDNISVSNNRLNVEGGGDITSVTRWRWFNWWWCNW